MSDRQAETCTPASPAKKYRHQQESSPVRLLQFCIRIDGRPSHWRFGHKYNVKLCIDAFAKFLKTELTNENVCTILMLAIQYDQIESMKAFEIHILLDTAAVFVSADFLKCCKKVLACIMKMNLLSCFEVDVFEACTSWVQNKSQQTIIKIELIETHLDKLYYDIRFSAMTIQELCPLSSKYSAVLSNDLRTSLMFSPYQRWSHLFSIHVHVMPWAFVKRPPRIADHYSHRIGRYFWELYINCICSTYAHIYRLMWK